MPRDTRTPHARSSAGLPAALLGLAWLALASCGERPDPLGPETVGLEASAILEAEATSPFVAGAPVQQGDLLGFSKKQVLTFLVPPVLTDPRSASKLIPAATGGFVELNGFRVDIPAGALTEDTVITLDLPATLPAANYVVADFGPHGLTFSRPVKLEFSLAGVDLLDIDLDTVKIWHWDGSKWREPRGRIEDGSVVRRTTHFSKFGARGIDTTSGG